MADKGGESRLSDTMETMQEKAIKKGKASISSNQRACKVRTEICLLISVTRNICKVGLVVTEIMKHRLGIGESQEMGR